MAISPFLCLTPVLPNCFFFFSDFSHVIVVPSLLPLTQLTSHSTPIRPIYPRTQWTEMASSSINSPLYLLLLLLIPTVHPLNLHPPRIGSSRSIHERRPTIRVLWRGKSRRNLSRYGRLVLSYLDRPVVGSSVWRILDWSLLLFFFGEGTVLSRREGWRKLGG